MNIKKPIIIALLIGITVTGCSTTSPLSEDGYDEFGLVIGGLDGCFNDGKITPKMYAETKAAISYRLSSRTYDQGKLQKKTDAVLGKMKPTPKLCRMVEAVAHRVTASASADKQQTKESAAAFSDSMKEMNRNKPVYCNKIGNTTICS